MIITIKHIDVAQVAEHEHGLTIYQVEFESEVTSGQTLLYSHADPCSLLPGSQISVETNQSKVVDFHVLASPNQLHTGRLVPLGTDNDYQVVGRVGFLYDEVFDVDVEPGSCSFVIGYEEISPTSVAQGNWVEFKVIGLELWDEHI